MIVILVDKEINFCMWKVFTKKKKRKERKIRLPL